MSAKPVVSASILSCDPADFRTPVSDMMRAGVDWVHFDVMDGQFVPPITFGHELVASLRKLGDTPFEAHLMTLTPEAHFQAFVDAGCKRVIFHTEATAHAHRLAQTLRQMGVEAGVAINPGTPVEAFEPLLDEIDLALIMTVNPGWGGQRFIPAMLDKVRRLRAMAPGLNIEVDGGVDPTTIRALWDAGVTTFVTGSFLVRSGCVRQAIEELLGACA